MKLLDFLPLIRNINESVKTITSHRGREYPMVVNPSVSELLGFLRRYTQGYARITISPNDVFVWSAHDLVHADFQYALELNGYEESRFKDGVLSTKPDFQADPGMWSVPRKIGPLWYEFDGNPWGSIAENPRWIALKSGLERQPTTESIVMEMRRERIPLRGHNGQPFELTLYWNPTVEELASLIQKSPGKELRGIALNPRDVAFWDALQAEHYLVDRYLRGNPRYDEETAESVIIHQTDADHPYHQNKFIIGLGTDNPRVAQYLRDPRFVDLYR